VSVDWELIRQGCPRCGAQRGGQYGLQFHSLSVWCLGCGWAKNWEPEKPREDVERQKEETS